MSCYSDIMFFDKALLKLQESLENKLPWLDKAYGRAYRLVENTQEGKHIYPAVYTGQGEYLSMLPNDNIGNFSWFEIHDPQDINTKVQGAPIISSDISVIFWCNLETIYPDNSRLYTENVKAEILKALNRKGVIHNGTLKVISVYESFENIYKGYTAEKLFNNSSLKSENITFLDKKFLMYPYYGIRIKFNLKIQELCLQK